MNSLDHLKNLYSKGSFREVLNQLERSEFLKNLDQDFDIKAKYFLNAIEKLKIRPSEKVLVDLIDKSHEKKSTEIFNLLINNFNSFGKNSRYKIDFYTTAWREYYSRGELTLAKDAFSEASRQMLRLKRYQALKRFSTEALESIGLDTTVLIALIRGHLGTGEMESLYRYFQDARELIVSNKKHLKLNALKSLVYEFFELDEDKRRDIKIHREFKEMYCCAFILCLRYSEEVSWDYEARKTFISNIFDLIVCDQNKNMNLVLLLEYALKFKRKYMAQNISLYFEVNKSIKRSLSKTVGRYVAEISSLPESEDEQLNTDEDFDMGTDLFAEEKVSIKAFEEIKKLERDVKFLQGAGQDEQAIQKMYELKKIDPENSLLVDLFERERMISGSSTMYREQSIEAVEARLIAEISNIVEDHYLEDLKKHSRNMRKVLELMSDEEVASQYVDLYTSMYQIGFYDVCLYIVGRIKGLSANKKMPDNEIANLEYLRSEALFAKGYYHETLDLCRDSLQKMVLIPEERNNFMYLAAESCMKLKKKTDAWQLYKKIAETNINFRLTKQRLDEIETG